jgi:hypothetical protein
MLTCLTDEPRYTTSPGQVEQSLRTGLDAALQARRMIEIDNPTVEGLQTLMLISQAFYAYGLGKKAYMTFCMLSPRSHMV